MEFGGCDDFGQFLHIRGFDIDDIEALILNVEIPKIDPEVITADEGFSITVNGDAVDVVGVGIGVGSARHRRNHCVMMCHARELQLLRVFELWWNGCASTTWSGRSDFSSEIILCDDFKRFFKHLP